MAHPKQLVPSYLKHRASGQALVTINGRDHYFGRHGTKVSELEYDRLITEWLASGRSSSYGVSDQAYSIAEMLADHLNGVRISFVPVDSPAEFDFDLTPMVSPNGVD